MALDFPLNPTTGTLYQTGSSATYEYTNRNYWEVVTPSPLEVISASFATSASYAVSSSLFVTNADTASFLRHTSSLFEVHVCANTGTDETGSAGAIRRGTILYPYRSINYALARIGTGSGYRLIVHRGQYAEDVNLTATNMHVVGYNAGNGSLVEINGTVTVGAASSSTRISNIRVNALRHTGAGTLFVDQVGCTVSASFASTYAEIIDSRFECSAGISQTAPGSLFVFGSTFSPLTTRGIGALSYLKDCIGVVNPTVNTGSLVLINCQVTSAVSGSPAINSTGTSTLVNLINSQVSTPDGAPTRINISGSLSYINAAFEKQGSSLGNQAGALTARFQNLDANLITVTGSVSITGSFTASAAFIASGSIPTASFLSGSIPTYVQANNGSQQSIPASTVTTLTNWTNVTTNNAAEWNPTTGTFTATKAGIYSVTAMATYAQVSPTVNTEYSIAVYKNASPVNSIWNFAETTQSRIRPVGPGTAIISMAVGDTLSVRAFQNMTGGAVSLNDRANATTITIEELSGRITR